MDEVKAFRDAGVHQVIVGGFSEDASTLKGDIEKLAEQIVVPSSGL